MGSELKNYFFINLKARTILSHKNLKNLKAITAITLPLLSLYTSTQPKLLCKNCFSMLNPKAYPYYRCPECNQDILIPYRGPLYGTVKIKKEDFMVEHVIEKTLVATPISIFTENKPPKNKIQYYFSSDKLNLLNMRNFEGNEYTGFYITVPKASYGYKTNVFIIPINIIEAGIILKMLKIIKEKEISSKTRAKKYDYIVCDNFFDLYSMFSNQDIDNAIYISEMNNRVINSRLDDLVYEGCIMGNYVVNPRL